MEDRILEKLKLKIAISEIKEESNKVINNKKFFLHNKFIAAACICIILTTGFTFGKEVEKYIKEIFSFSTDAIDLAIEEGYVQKVNDDFIYSNGLGIKVDNILIDNVNLIFSLLYKTEENNIENISINYFSIYTENGERVYQYDETKKAYVGIAKSMEKSDVEKKTEKEFINTIMLNLWEERNEFSELDIKIKDLNIIYSDGTQKNLEGNWDIHINISEKFKENNEVKYIFDGENEYIKEASATLYPTKMIVKLELFENYDIDKIVEIALEDLSEYGMIFSLKNNEKVFRHTNFDYIEYDKELIIIFENIGSYMKLEDELELSLKIYDTKILLKKDK